jgi:hypothetical protein
VNAILLGSRLRSRDLRQWVGSWPTRITGHSTNAQPARQGQPLEHAPSVQPPATPENDLSRLARVRGRAMDTLATHVRVGASAGPLGDPGWTNPPALEVQPTAVAPTSRPMTWSPRDTRPHRASAALRVHPAPSLPGGAAAIYFIVKTRVPSQPGGGGVSSATWHRSRSIRLGLSCNCALSRLAASSKRRC